MRLVTHDEEAKEEERYSTCSMLSSQLSLLFTSSHFHSRKVLVTYSPGVQIHSLRKQSLAACGSLCRHLPWRR